MSDQLFDAIKNRDAEALATIANADGHQHDNVVNNTAERLVDALFKQLKQVFPAAENTNLRSEAQEVAAKRQWIAAFAESGIRTREQLSAGMRRARASESPFWPSPGQFVAWCKDPAATLGVGIDDVMDEFHRYNRDRSQYDSPEAFPWRHPVLYWIVCDARGAMYQRCLSEQEVEKYAMRKLSEWAKKIAAGENVPTPVALISEKREAPDKPPQPQGDGDYGIRYMPNASFLGSVTPAQWLYQEYKRRKANLASWPGQGSI